MYDDLHMLCHYYQIYNTIQLIFDVALLFAHAKLRSAFSDSCNVEHCRRGTCSRFLRDGQSGIRTCEPADGKHRTLPLSYHAPRAIRPACLCMYVCLTAYLSVCLSISPSSCGLAVAASRSGSLFQECFVVFVE